MINDDVGKGLIVKSKKVWIILIISLVVLFIILALIFGQSNKLRRECEKYNQNNKLMCLAAATGDSSYCEKIILFEPNTGISFYSDKDMKEQCYINLETFKKIHDENFSDILKSTDCDTLNSKGKSICLGLKTNDTSYCDNMSYDIKYDILGCKAIVSKDLKYCEMIEEKNTCQ